MMKFAVVVAPLASSLASVSAAADANGYSGSDYTFVGAGYCTPAGSDALCPATGNTHYNTADSDMCSSAYWAAGSCTSTTQVASYTLNACADHCQSIGNLEGQVGFDMDDWSCLCRYTDGTGPVSTTTEEGLDYSNSDSSGAIAGADGCTWLTPLCYRRNAFGQVSMKQDARIVSI